jgi:hypothetical protein
VFSDDGKVAADQPKNKGAIVKTLKFFAGHPALVAGLLTFPFAGEARAA